MTTISARNRREHKNTLDAAIDHVAFWRHQRLDEPFELRLGSHAEKLRGMGDYVGIAGLAMLICGGIDTELEDGDFALGVQLSQTAYDSLMSLGVDCARFDWAQEFEEVSCGR